ncbi:hypothetical protein PTTG_07027, partial [Puccinia triticina 1-1 BBBD Race 1]
MRYRTSPTLTTSAAASSVPWQGGRSIGVAISVDLRSNQRPSIKVTSAALGGENGLGARIRHTDLMGRASSGQTPHSRAGSPGPTRLGGVAQVHLARSRTRIRATHLGYRPLGPQPLSRDYRAPGMANSRRPVPTPPQPLEPTGPCLSPAVTTTPSPWLPPSAPALLVVRAHDFYAKPDRALARDPQRQHAPAARQPPPPPTRAWFNTFAHFNQARANQGDNLPDLAPQPMYTDLGVTPIQAELAARIEMPRNEMYGPMPILSGPQRARFHLDIPLCWLSIGL